MKRIAIFQTDLKVGGIQKSLYQMLRTKPFSAVQVDLFLFSSEAEFEARFSSNVSIKYLKSLPRASRLLSFDFLLKVFKNVNAVELKKERYDLAIDYNGYSPDCALAALTCDAHQRIIWVHNDYTERLRYDGKFRLAFFFARQKYQYFNSIVAVSDGALEGIRGLAKIPSDQRVIQNYIDVQDIRSKARHKCDVHVDSSRTNIIYVGRLDRIKRVDFLIREFAEAHTKNNALMLYIVGAGPQESKLRTMVSSLGIANEVCFLGKLANPYPIIQSMSALCLTSYYEGQGVVLREAQCLNVPCLFTHNLEKYQSGDSHGVDNLSEALVSLDGRGCLQDDLALYLDIIETALYDLLDS